MIQGLVLWLLIVYGPNGPIVAGQTQKYAECIQVASELPRNRKLKGRCVKTVSSLGPV